MSKIKEELDFLYKESNNQNKILLEKRAVNILIRELATHLQKEKAVPDGILAIGVMHLNEVLNKHKLCTDCLIQKDSFVDYLLHVADENNLESIKENLQIEKARRNLLEANDDYGWAEDCAVSEEELIE